MFLNILQCIVSAHLLYFRRQISTKVDNKINQSISQSIFPFLLCSTGLGFQLRCQKMGRSSLLFITLTVCLSSLWSLAQTSQSLDWSDSIQMTQSTERSNNSTNSLSSEAILSSDSSDSVEGSGRSIDHMISQKVINWTVLPAESEQAGNENPPRFGLTLTTLELTLGHLGAHDQDTDSANTSSTGQHTITEEKFKKRHTTTVHDDFVAGK